MEERRSGGIKQTEEFTGAILPGVSRSDRSDASITALPCTCRLQPIKPGRHVLTSGQDRGGRATSESISSHLTCPTSESAHSRLCFPLKFGRKLSSSLASVLRERDRRALVIFGDTAVDFPQGLKRFRQNQIHLQTHQAVMLVVRSRKEPEI